MTSIPDLILGVVSSVLTGVITPLFDAIGSPPSWFVDAWSKFSDVLNWTDYLNTWVPVTLTLSIALAVIVVWVASIGLTIVLKIVSYLTLGGGAT